MGGGAEFGLIGTYLSTLFNPLAGSSKAIEQARFGIDPYEPNRVVKMHVGWQGNLYNPRFVIDQSHIRNEFEVGVNGPINGKVGMGERPSWASRHAFYAGSRKSGFYGILAVRTKNDKDKPLFKPLALGIRYVPGCGFLDLDLSKKSATFTGTVDVNLSGGVVATPFITINKEYGGRKPTYYSELQLSKDMAKLEFIGGKLVLFVRGEYVNDGYQQILEGDKSAQIGLIFVK